MGRARRLVDAALEDFGVRRPRRPARRAVGAEQPATDATPAKVPIRTPPKSVPPVDQPAVARPDGVVWQGAARRRPELQRFCDHLESIRAAV